MKKSSSIILSIILMAGGITLLLFSTTLVFFYDTTYPKKPNYDAPIDGTPYILIVFIGVVLFSVISIGRSLLKPSQLKNLSVCCYCWGVIPLFFPVFLIIGSYSPGLGFLFYLLSLIPIISSIVVLNKGALPSRTTSISRGKSSPFKNLYSQSSQGTSSKENLGYSMSLPIRTCSNCGETFNSRENTFCTECGQLLQ